MAKTGLNKSETIITFTPRNNKTKDCQPIVRDDFSSNPTYKRGTDLQVIHNPSNGSAGSARTNIVYNSESISYKPPIDTSGVEEFDPFKPSQKGLLIADGAEVRLVPEGSSYSQIIISRQSRPTQLPEMKPIAQVVEELVRYDSHKTKPVR